MIAGRRAVPAPGIANPMDGKARMTIILAGRR
jgi:hypothetical protein